MTNDQKGAASAWGVKIDPNIPSSYGKMTKEQQAGYDAMLKQLYSMPFGSGYDIATQMQKDARPEYVKNKAYDENIALARASAFGTDRGIEGQVKAIDESSAEAMGKATQYSSSTSGLLEALSNVTTGKNKALRGIAQDQGAIQQQKLAALMGANVMGAEEEDKAWNYNTNQPYQMGVQETRDRRKYYEEHANDALDFVGGLAGSLIPGLGNIFGGSKSKNVSAGYGGGGAVGWMPNDGNDYGYGG